MNPTSRHQVYVPHSKGCENLAALALSSAPETPTVLSQFRSFITGPAYFQTVQAASQPKEAVQSYQSKIPTGNPLTLPIERSKSCTLQQGRPFFNPTPGTVIPTNFFPTYSYTVIPTISQKAFPTHSLQKTPDHL